MTNAPIDPNTKTVPLVDRITGGKFQHLFRRRHLLAVNMSLTSGRPLLVRGEPGTGKSELARAAAAVLGWPFVSMTLDAHTEPRDLMWTMDAVGRLAEAQLVGALKELDEDVARARLDERAFVTPGPLWWAFKWGSAEHQLDQPGVQSVAPARPKGWAPGDGVVVLLDEIDKADPSVPNGLLEALGEARFRGPGAERTVAREGRSPLIVITTNEERVLPDAFLRRCLVLQMKIEAGEALERDLVDLGVAHFPKTGAKVLERAAKLLRKDRELWQERRLAAPGIAEYLDLLRAVTAQEKDETAQLDLLAELAEFALRKHDERLT